MWLIYVCLIVFVQHRRCVAQKNKITYGWPKENDNITRLILTGTCFLYISSLFRHTKCSEHDGKFRYPVHHDDRDLHRLWDCYGQPWDYHDGPHQKLLLPEGEVLNAQRYHREQIIPFTELQYMWRRWQGDGSTDFSLQSQNQTLLTIKADSLMSVSLLYSELIFMSPSKRFYELITALHVMMTNSTSKTHLCWQIVTLITNKMTNSNRGKK